MNCGTKGCTGAATRLVLWPGQTLPMCDFCVRRACGVAQALGFELATDPPLTTLADVERELAQQAMKWLEPEEPKR